MRPLPLLAPAMLCAFCASAAAQLPPVLLEACSAMEPSSRRLQCLRAANDLPSAQGIPTAPSAHPPAAPRRFMPRQSPPLCHVAPGGDTYTITASGQRDYGGC